MKKTAQKHNDIQWSPFTLLNGLDFAEDIAILSHNQLQMQDKTRDVAENSTKQVLNIHRGKSTVLKVNTVNTALILLEGSALDDVETFTYLGSIV